jgi:hypothetical protein
MSSIYTSGYGYSKIICEDVTSWFLNNFFPRHKIDVDIIHKGLKRDGVVGYCDVVGHNYRPRHFMIELQTGMDKETYIKTLLHELTHLKQWVEGSLRFRSGKLCYSQEPVENWDYEHQPHEIEARDEEERLYDWYMSDTFGVPDGEVAQRFSNLLCTTL